MIRCLPVKPPGAYAPDDISAETENKQQCADDHYTRTGLRLYSNNEHDHANEQSEYAHSLSRLPKLCGGFNGLNFCAGLDCRLILRWRGVSNRL